MSLVETVLSPFQFAFMINALVISTVVAVPMALLSCFLVLKGWSLMGDAISHAVFPGVVLAYIFGFPYAVGAFAAGMICATGSVPVPAGCRRLRSRITTRRRMPCTEPWRWRCWQSPSAVGRRRRWRKA